jgi:hypothetical protein
VGDGELRERLKQADAEVGIDDAVALYHATSLADAKRIVDSGVLEATPADPGAVEGPATVYLSTSPAIIAVHGGQVIVPIRVRVQDLAGETRWPPHPDEPVERIDFSITESPYRPLAIGQEAFADRENNAGDAGRHILD